MNVCGTYLQGNLLPRLNMKKARSLRADSRKVPHMIGRVGLEPSRGTTPADIESAAFAVLPNNLFVSTQPNYF